MISLKVKKEYYQALLEKKTEYEGVFYVGVKTTGVFADRLVLPENRSSKTANSLRRQNKQCLRHFAPARGVNLYPTRIVFLTW